MLSIEDVKNLVENGIPAAQVQVSDLTGTSDHFRIEVVADAFVGKSAMDRHRLVHAALGQYLGREIHAVDIKTRTPDQARG